MENIEIYTDGSCINNGQKKNYGGYCAIINGSGYKDKVISGSQLNTTNNQMELKAVIEPLKSFTKPYNIRVHSDSQLVVNGAMIWLDNWKKNGYKGSNKKTIANKNLWQELDLLCQKHTITFVHVKAHSGNTYNELCDKKALEEAKNLQTTVLQLSEEQNRKV